MDRPLCHLHCHKEDVLHEAQRSNEHLTMPRFAFAPSIHQCYVIEPLELGDGGISREQSLNPEAVSLQGLLDDQVGPIQEHSQGH